MWSKIWANLVNEEETGKSDCQYVLNDEAFIECKEFYGKKNKECTYHQSENNLHKIENSSKSTEQVLRLVAPLQLIDKSFIFLKNNKDFDPSNIDQCEQPLLPNATTIEAKYFRHAVKLLETCQEQRDTLSDE